MHIHTHSDIYVRTELALVLLFDYLGQGLNEVLKKYLRDSGGIKLRPTVLLVSTDSLISRVRREW